MEKEGVVEVGRKKLLVSFFVLFWSSSSFAAHPLTTDDIYPVDAGTFELELSYDTWNKKAEPRNHSLGVSLKGGITERMDIGISFPFQIQPYQEEPFGNITLGIKFLLLKDIFALTVSNEFGLSDYFINGIFTHEFGSITGHANIGYTVSGDKEDEGEIRYSAAIEYSLWKIDLVGEVLGDSIGFQNYLFGVRYKISEMVFIDCAYGNGFRETGDRVSIGFHAEF
jgi:hypothetical protein